MNPELTVADVVELPKPKQVRYITHKRQMFTGDKDIKTVEERITYNKEEEIYNQCLSEISSLKLSPEKVVGMVILDEKELKEAIGALVDWNEVMMECIYQAISSNKSKILGVKGKHD